MTRVVHKCVFGFWTARYIGKWVPIVKGVETIVVYNFFAIYIYIIIKLNAYKSTLVKVE